MKEEHPEYYCQKCKGKNTIWFADNDIWNSVMDGEKEGIVCPQCFMDLADLKLGEILIFKVGKV